MHALDSATVRARLSSCHKALNVDTSMRYAKLDPRVGKVLTNDQLRKLWNIRRDEVSYNSSISISVPTSGLSSLVSFCLAFSCSVWFVLPFVGHFLVQFGLFSFRLAFPCWFLFLSTDNPIVFRLPSLLAQVRHM